MAPDRGVESPRGINNQSQDNVLPSLSTLSLEDEPQPSQTLDKSLIESNISPSLPHEPTPNVKRSDPFQFGQRYLSETDDVFTHNAWDHVVPDTTHDEYCEAQYAVQRAAPVSDFDRQRFNTNPEKWWDLFYKQKTSTFFKDRKWLGHEFPILFEVTREDAGKKVVLEVGAGAGNTAFPILSMNENRQLKLIAADFSKRAVETMKSSEQYSASEEIMKAIVWDAADNDLPEGLADASVDVVIMIFIFSALSPQQWDQAVHNISRILKPGGEVLFRDYGRGDLAQVRFKTGRWMSENFYVRGDGTRVYFFDKEELEAIWGRAFEILNLEVDRRLIVNRQRRIKMYRCWMQGRFKKQIAT